MRVLYRTFGCKANQYDTERMRQELEALGALSAGAVRAADVCVVNTCTVTNQADADARRFIRRVRRKNPDLRIVVAGCSSALNPEAYRTMDGVTAVVEGHNPIEVARAGLQAVKGKRDPAGQDLGLAEELIQLGPRTTGTMRSQEPRSSALLRKRRGGTRGWLKIQDGCDRKCSFCATRLARGESRSRPPEDLVAEAKLLARSHPELVLTGIHIGHYGRDLGRDGLALSHLVSRLLEEVPTVRFRLGSIEATEVDDGLLDLMEESGGRLAPHLHMPLQSGADPVLKRMRRWHTREMYRTRGLEIAHRFPVLGLGADLITGFPGETEEDHVMTRSLVEELPFTYLHVFPFSPRDGTPAMDLPDPVPQRIAGERSRELRELAREKGVRYREARIGSWATLVVEGQSGWALTEDYLRVRVRSGPVDDPPVSGEPRAPGEPRKTIGSGGSPDTVRCQLHGTGEDLYIDLSHPHQH